MAKNRHPLTSRFIAVISGAKISVVLTARSALSDEVDCDLKGSTVRDQ